MNSTPMGVRVVPVSALLLAAAATTHCAADDMASEAHVSATDEAPVLVTKHRDPRVTYQLLVARYNPDLSIRDVHTGSLGGFSLRYASAPGAQSRTMRDFLHGDRGSHEVDAPSHWIVFEDHAQRQSHHWSTCDGQEHVHAYPTWVDGQYTEVEVDYVCVPADGCGREARCALELTFHPTYCASAAR